jgi:hypothetical protein
VLITLSVSLIGFAVVFGSASSLFADYTLILKNGRTVNVETYKEEGGRITFSSYGGEISIAKEDVQSIIPAVEGLATRQVSPQTEVLPAKPPEPGPGEERLPRPGQEQGMEGMKDEPLATKEKVLTPEEIRAEERAKEEKEYQNRLSEVTAKLKAVTDRFLIANKRTTGPQPTKPCVVDCDQETKARVADLNSRLKDAVRTPAGPDNRGSVKIEQPSPFQGLPPTIRTLKPGGAMQRVQPPPAPYSAKEKKLSLLRKQILNLENERDRLIQEMREKDFRVNAASLTSF